MTTATEVRLQAVDDLLAALLPMLNKLSSRAWFVQQGRLEEARDVEADLNRWIQQNRAIVDTDVVAEVSRLSRRVTEWLMSLGTSDTPGSLREGEGSFTSVQRKLELYKETLLATLDQRETETRTHVAKEVARDVHSSPWVSGSFYLSAVIVLLAGLAVVANTIPAWAFPLVLVAAVLLVSIVGALQLRHDDRLSEKGFVKLMIKSLKSVPLLTRSKPEPPRTDMDAS